MTVLLMMVRMMLLMLLLLLHLMMMPLLMLFLLSVQQGHILGQILRERLACLGAVIHMTRAIVLVHHTGIHVRHVHVLLCSIILRLSELRCLIA